MFKSNKEKVFRNVIDLGDWITNVILPEDSLFASIDIALYKRGGFLFRTINSTKENEKRKIGFFVFRPKNRISVSP
jgi:hypothetical protein